MKGTGERRNSGEKQREFEIVRRKRKRQSKYSEVKNGSVRTSKLVKG